MIVTGDNDCVFRVRNIGQAFADKTIWLESIDIPRGKVTAIVGASGSGKSTFLHLLGGLSRPNLRRLAGEPLAAEQTASVLQATFRKEGRWPQFNLLENIDSDYTNNVGFVFQSAFLLQAVPSSVNIALGAACANRQLDGASLDWVSDHLAIRRNFLDKRTRYRSGGERQRIAVARAISRDPEVILADEPTASLDPQLSEEIIGFLHNWCRVRSHRSVVWVTHDVHLASKFADVVIALHEGKLLGGGEWPRPNPRDPEILLKWIRGQSDTSRSVAEVCSSADVAVISGNELVRRSRSSSSLLIWMKVGMAQIFDGPSCDGIRTLRRLCSIRRDTNLAERGAINGSAPAFEPTGSSEGWGSSLGVVQAWRSFGAKSAVLRLAFLLALIVGVWANLDLLTKNLIEALKSPTINPVVVSTRKDHGWSCWQPPGRALVLDHGKTRNT